MLLLVACDFTPQEVTPTIVPRVVASQEGRGAAVTVAVEDAGNLTAEPIGYWGKEGSKDAPMTLSGDTKAALQKALVQAFAAKGFAVRSGATRQMSARLVDLRYRNRYDFWKIGLHADAALEVTAAHAGKTYTRLYSTHVERWWFAAPSEKKNAKYLNKALSELVAQVAEDKALVVFLAGR